jgi:thioredoxin 1
MVAPVLEEIAAQKKGRLKVVKVNVDESPRVASRFAISSIPALKIFKNGRVVDQAVGAMPRDALESLVAQHL